MNFNALTAAKFIATGIVGLGTSKIVGGIIKNNVAAPETLIDKVTTVAAAWVISGMASSATKKYTDEAIDGAVKAVSEIVDGIKTTKKLARIQNNISTFEEEGLDPEDFVQDPITKVWSKIEPTEPKTVEDDMYEKMNRRAKDAGLSFGFEKINGVWSMIDDTKKDSANWVRVADDEPDGK